MTKEKTIDNDESIKAQIADACGPGCMNLAANQSKLLDLISPSRRPPSPTTLEYLKYVLSLVAPLLLLFVLYYFRKYYKTHNNIYMFVSIFIVLYVLLYYIIFFELPMKFILGTGTDNVEP